eukprot:7714074-Alexandrium_andersonii.AAC.1
MRVSSAAHRGSPQGPRSSVLHRLALPGLRRRRRGRPDCGAPLNSEGDLRANAALRCGVSDSPELPTGPCVTPGLDA